MMENGGNEPIHEFLLLASIPLLIMILRVVPQILKQSGLIKSGAWWRGSVFELSQVFVAVPVVILLMKVLRFGWPGFLIYGNEIGSVTTDIAWALLLILGPLYLFLSQSLYGRSRQAGSRRIVHDHVQSSALLHIAIFCGEWVMICATATCGGL